MAEPKGTLAFLGVLLSSREFDLEHVHVGARVGFVGTDSATVDLVGRAVDAGHRVKVFEDHPRAVVPTIGFTLPRTAEALVVTADVLRIVTRITGSLAGGAPLRRAAYRLAASIDGCAATSLRSRQVPDRWTRRQVTPNRLDSRPPLRSSRFLSAIASSNCELISWPIAEFSPAGIRTCDGIEHRLDAIVLAD